MEPFFVLPPATIDNNPRGVVPWEVIDAFTQIASKEVESVINRVKTIDEAIETLQIDGQQAIDQAVFELSQNQK